MYNVCLYVIYNSACKAQRLAVMQDFRPFLMSFV